jgi:hypothetical protein
MSFHRCPRRGCLTSVPDAMFACFPCWGLLPSWVRSRIGKTSRQNILNPERRSAIAAARDAWDQLR